MLKKQEYNNIYKLAVDENIQELEKIKHNYKKDAFVKTLYDIASQTEHFVTYFHTDHLTDLKHYVYDLEPNFLEKDKEILKTHNQEKDMAFALLRYDLDTYHKNDLLKPKVKDLEQLIKQEQEYSIKSLIELGCRTIYNPKNHKKMISEAIKNNKDFSPLLLVDEILFTFKNTTVLLENVCQFLSDEERVIFFDKIKEESIKDANASEINAEDILDYYYLKNPEKFDKDKEYYINNRESYWVISHYYKNTYLSPNGGIGKDITIDPLDQVRMACIDRQMDKLKRIQNAYKPEEFALILHEVGFLTSDSDMIFYAYDVNNKLLKQDEKSDDFNHKYMSDCYKKEKSLDQNEKLKIKI